MSVLVKNTQDCEKNVRDSVFIHILREIPTITSISKSDEEKSAQLVYLLFCL